MTTIAINTYKTIIEKITSKLYSISTRNSKQNHTHRHTSARRKRQNNDRVLVLMTLQNRTTDVSWPHHRHTLNPTKREKMKIKQKTPYLWSPQHKQEEIKWGLSQTPRKRTTDTLRALRHRKKVRTSPQTIWSSKCTQKRERVFCHRHHRMRAETRTPRQTQKRRDWDPYHNHYQNPSKDITADTQNENLTTEP